MTPAMPALPPSPAVTTRESPAAGVRLENLSKRFGSHVVLQDITPANTSPPCNPCQY